MKVSVEHGIPRCTSPGTSKARYPTIDATPGALRGGAVTNSQTRPCSWPTTISTLAASPSNREALRSGITLAPMSSTRVPGGVVHKLPADLREALTANSTALAAWKDITPLARNEFICWVDDAKQETTRKRRIRRTQEELEEGQRRPCCWPGCKHRERTGK
jgi:bacteriocin resistance YdeI/OmpD-like protein